MDKKRQAFEKICKDIKSIKIQGARNVAKAGLKAYTLNPSMQAKRKLIGLRPTEPMLKHVLELADSHPYKEILTHFDQSQKKINLLVLKIIKNKEIIFTHCHSTNVVRSLIYAKKKGKNFAVHNTETRPLFQGRTTAKELEKNKIPVTIFVDSAFASALFKSQTTKKVDKIFLGADALTSSGIINKVGSRAIAELAHNHHIPLFVIADSWKYSKEPILIESRKGSEVWQGAPKKIKIKNPAFEFVPKNYITKIITEKGNNSYDAFLKKVAH